MKRSNVLILFLLLWIFQGGCSSEERRDISIQNPDLLHQAEEKLTDIIVHDIFSPPVASRVYAYANLAAYETLIHDHPEYRSLVGQLNGLESLPKPEANLEYAFPLAGLHAFCLVGKQLIFSEQMMENFYKNLYDSLKVALPEKVFDNSLAFGETMAKAVLDYANTDGYKETRGLKYTVMNETGKWAPTPPAYMDAIEPFWNRIRPFVLDSASQFTPEMPTPYSLEENSLFYEEIMEVYSTGKNLTTSQKEIASFWDCNPFVMHTVGHVMFATKKITPGGHWMGITYIANKKENADIMKSAEAYTMVAITLADGFISCWDEKYRSNVIRPETVINAHFDENWEPLLQTPPFPEYPSGHSVISKAASVTLTSLYGDNFHFVDSTEIKFGLPARTFSSFQSAAEEAAISRLYGGIHYMPAITNGIAEGEKVGNKVINTIQTRKNFSKNAVSQLKIRRSNTNY